MKNTAIYSATPFGKWLLDRNESATEFSRRSFISTPTIYRALRGEAIRCSTVKKILYFAKQLSEEDFKTIDYSFMSIEGNSAIT